MPDWLALYLEEDLGPDGVDVTTDALVPAGLPSSARVVARERCFAAGLAVAAEVFGRCGASAEPALADGSWAEAGAVLLRVRGPARAILRGERLALNVLGRMSGVATATRALVERLAEAGASCRVAATRKTTPGFRAFEKEAVRLAGGDPHRQGLFDAAMVKDNHRAAAGSVAAAVRKVRRAHPGVPLTVEVESLEDALAATAAGADWLLIDNQDPATGRAWAEQVWARRPDVGVEASGGIRPDRVLDYAWADRVSLGALTRDARTPDLSLEWGDGGAGRVGGVGP